MTPSKDAYNEVSESRGHILNPLKPKNASDNRLAITKVIGTSLNDLGTSANSSLSRIPAMRNMASVYPAPAPSPWMTDFKKLPDRSPSAKIVADHSRAMSYLISDSVLPSNEGRGLI